MSRDDVVALLCRLASDSKKRNVSKVELLRQSGYSESEPIPEQDIEAYLRLHPDLVDAWIRDSEDQRTSKGWWITEPLDCSLLERLPYGPMRTMYAKCRTERGWTVGNLPETIRRTFDDRFKACTFHVRQRIRDLAELADRSRSWCNGDFCAPG